MSFFLPELYCTIGQYQHCSVWAAARVNKTTAYLIWTGIPWISSGYTQIKSYNYTQTKKKLFRVYIDKGRDSDTTQSAGTLISETPWRNFKQYEQTYKKTQV